MITDDAATAPESGFVDTVDFAAPALDEPADPAPGLATSQPSALPSGGEVVAWYIAGSILTAAAMFVCGAGATTAAGTGAGLLGAGAAALLALRTTDR